MDSTWNGLYYLQWALCLCKGIMGNVYEALSWNIEGKEKQRKEEGEEEVNL